jgi:hypothetical protein
MNIRNSALLVALPGLAALGVAVMAPSASAVAPNSNGQKAAFFTGGTGRAGWVNGNDGAAPGDTDGKVMSLTSPDGSSYGGFAAHAIDGVDVSDITALSYDFDVTSPDWSGGGGGSPRLVVEFSDGGNVALNPVTSLTSGTWVHMDAMTGAVDNEGGSCGFQYQISWSDAAACHAGESVTDAFVVVDSGWVAPMSVQVDNLTLNNTVYTSPGTAKR